MPWRCPACDTHIQHGPGEPAPRTGAVYRCHVCRLELVVDLLTNRLVLAPFGDGADLGKRVR